MINPDPMLRPTASRLVTLVALRTNGANSKSRTQLYKELREARARLKLLEQELEKKSSTSPEFPTPPKDKESSDILISPIALASNSGTNPSASQNSNFDACMTRSKDCPKGTISSKTSIGM